MAAEVNVTLGKVKEQETEQEEKRGNKDGDKRDIVNMKAGAQKERNNLPPFLEEHNEKGCSYKILMYLLYHSSCTCFCFMGCLFVNSFYYKTILNKFTEIR